MRKPVSDFIEELQSRLKPKEVLSSRIILTRDEMNALQELVIAVSNMYKKYTGRDMNEDHKNGTLKQNIDEYSRKQKSK